MSIMSYNGGAVIAMKGKECVAIASDLRYGVQAQTVSFDFQKVFQMNDKLFLGLAGLATDVQTVSNIVKLRLNIYQLEENRQIKPHSFMSMVSNLLYSRRFGPYFIEPIIAGLDPKTNVPFVASCDLIGCPMIPEDFVVTGTCSEQLYGMCESLWEPDLEPDDLFETISQALLNAVDRDAVSGWGAVVHIIYPMKPGWQTKIYNDHVKIYKPIAEAGHHETTGHVTQNIKKHVHDNMRDDKKYATSPSFDDHVLYFEDLESK